MNVEHIEITGRNWMAGMSGFDFNAETLLVFLIERLIWFFAIIFSFVSILFGVFRKPWLRLLHLNFLKCNDRLRRLNENKYTYMYLTNIFAGLQIFSCLTCFFSFHFTWIFNETSLDFVFWCRSFFVNKRLFFFAIIFGFVFILYGVFWPKKPFFIIGEEEDFLDSLFLFENEALLIVDVELQVIVNL